jgi:peptidoglycan/xylan/chitin deacetylase (PgdA/CDA1 family)
MWRTLYTLLSPAGKNARLSVLIFHRVRPALDPLFPGDTTAESFERHLSWVRERFNVLSLREAVERLRRASLPSRALSITFDDGYADNCTVALPILRRHGLPATVFVAAGYLDGGTMWNDAVIEAIRGCPHSRLDVPPLAVGPLQLESLEQRRAAVHRLIDAFKYRRCSERADAVQRLIEASGSAPPRDLMLTTAQLRTLARAGIDIGAHTMTHPILARTEDDQARWEIEHGKAQLEAILEQPVTLFAYPNGKPNRDYAPRHVEMVARAGFAAAVTTAWGAARTGSDVLQLPRFTPWDRSHARYGLRLARNLIGEPAFAEATA